MTKEEFTNKIKQILKTNYKYTEQKINNLLNSAEVKQILEDDYKYLNNKSMNISPEATASTIDMLY